MIMTIYVDLRGTLTQFSVSIAQTSFTWLPEFVSRYLFTPPTIHANGDNGDNGDDVMM